MSIGDFPESLSQAILVRMIMLVGGLGVELFEQRVTLHVSLLLVVLSDYYY